MAGHRPDLDIKTASQLITKLYGLEVLTIKELCSYDDKNYLITVGRSWKNGNIQKLWPHGYVFKILNYDDSMASDHVDAEHGMMELLSQHDLSCPLPVRNKYGDHTAKEYVPLGAENSASIGGDTKYHTCRLMSYVPGKILYSVPYTPDLMVEAGVYVAHLRSMLQGYFHQALVDLDIIWRLESVPKLRNHVASVRDEKNRALALDVIDTFEREVIPLYPDLPKGTIHGDFNDHNIIVTETTENSQTTNSISGVIDFGDASYSYYIFDIAITIMYLSLESTSIDSLAVGKHVLKGYLSKASLSQLERNLLKFCVAGRYTQSVVMGEYSHRKEPDNDYLLVTVDKGWPQLRALWDTPIDELNKLWEI